MVANATGDHLIMFMIMIKYVHSFQYLVKIIIIVNDLTTQTHMLLTKA